MKIILEQTTYLKQHAYHEKNMEKTQDKKVKSLVKMLLKRQGIMINMELSLH